MLFHRHPVRQSVQASRFAEIRREVSKAADGTWWTHKGSNLGPLPCEGNALPLSYASGISCDDQRPVNRRLIGQSTLSEPAIYEGQGTGVKLSASNRLKRSGRLLLAGAGGVVLQRPDALGQGAAAVGGTAAIGGGAVRHGAAGGAGGFRRHFRF